MDLDVILNKLHEIRQAFRTPLNGRRRCLTCMPVVESELLVVELKRIVLSMRLQQEKEKAHE